MDSVANYWPWHWPIFPEGYPSSIVGAGAFHCRVRDGNGWCHPAQNTRTRFTTCHPERSEGFVGCWGRGFLVAIAPRNDMKKSICACYMIGLDPVTGTYALFHVI